MKSPAPQPEPLRTCPACRRPVPPGFHFCESCGARVPELLTCSNCGTQFITPVTTCELCGAPVTAEHLPEKIRITPRHRVPEHSAGRNDRDSTGEEPAEDAEPDQQQDTAEGPGYEEGAEPEEPDEPAREDHVRPAGRTPEKHYSREIPIPSTREILDRFGNAGEDTPASRSRKQHMLPGGSPAPARREPEATESDDALFLIDNEVPAPAKPAGRLPADRLRIAGVGILLLILAIAGYLVILPMITGSGETGTPGSYVVVETTLPSSPVTVTTAVPARTPAPLPTVHSYSLATVPTQTLPGGQKVYFQVQKSPVSAKITVIFIGSAGSDGIRSAEVTITHPGGAVATGLLLPLKGISEITLDGSRGADRVVIMAEMSSGETYRVYDGIVPYTGD